jgi:hypothetical protein
MCYHPLETHWASDMHHPCVFHPSAREWRIPTLKTETEVYLLVYIFAHIKKKKRIWELCCLPQVEKSGYMVIIKLINKQCILSLCNACTNRNISPL